MDKEIINLVKSIPRTYWFVNSAYDTFIERVEFLKEKGLSMEEIEQTLKLLYEATAHNNGYWGKKIA